MFNVECTVVRFLMVLLVFLFIFKLSRNLRKPDPTVLL